MNINELNLYLWILFVPNECTYIVLVAGKVPWPRADVVTCLQALVNVWPPDVL